MKDQGEILGGDEILQVRVCVCVCVCVCDYRVSILFQVSSTEVLGLEHNQAIEVVKETLANVMIVVGRRIRPVSHEEEEEGECVCVCVCVCV